jgi:hypothetical protein
MKSLKSAIYSFLLLLTPFLMSSTVQGQAVAEKGQAAIGVMLGEPTGINLKFWQNTNRAYDLGVAWSLQGNEAISIHGDYLWHTWLTAEKGDLAVQYGIGARAWFSDNDSAVGARIPIGLNYLFEDAPIGVFVEIAPIIDLLPSTDSDGSGGIGARFYF